MAGAKAGSPATSLPSDSGLAPSTSLAGGIAVARPARFAPSGSGVCSMTPCTSGSSASWASMAAMPAAVVVRDTSQAIPSLAAALAIERT